jgi:hypothetical protein
MVFQDTPRFLEWVLNSTQPVFVVGNNGPFSNTPQRCGLRRNCIGQKGYKIGHFNL